MSDLFRFGVGLDSEYTLVADSLTELAQRFVLAAADAYRASWTGDSGERYSPAFAGAPGYKVKLTLTLEREGDPDAPVWEPDDGPGVMPKIRRALFGPVDLPEPRSYISMKASRDPEGARRRSAGIMVGGHLRERTYAPEHLSLVA